MAFSKVHNMTVNYNDSVYITNLLKCISIDRKILIKNNIKLNYFFECIHNKNLQKNDKKGS